MIDLWKLTYNVFAYPFRDEGNYYTTGANNGKSKIIEGFMILIINKPSEINELLKNNV